MVVQDRIVIDAPKSLEAPHGFIEIGETPAAASRREHMEETGNSKKTDGMLIPLGSVAFHQAVANRVHLFLVVNDVTSKEFKVIQKQLLNRKGGLKEDGETMDVKLMPLHKAYEEVCASGNSACTEIHLGRAMDYLKIRRPIIAFQ
jgi:predicted NUDIX family NTP pyrophosphohydrolase